MEIAISTRSINAEIDTFIRDQVLAYRGTVHKQKAAETHTGIMQEVGAHSAVRDYASMNDERLVIHAAQGNSAAFEVLYKRHHSSCYFFALKLVSDPCLAEDIVQDVFLKLWANPAAYSAAKGKFSSWLMTLIHNSSIDKLRFLERCNARNARPIIREEDAGNALTDTLSDPLVNIEREICWREQCVALGSALSQLTPKQQQVIHMTYFRGLSQKEIACRLGVPLNTVKTRSHYALMRLRKILAAQYFV